MKYPTQFQRLLALFVKDDGSFVGKLIPIESYWNYAFNKARLGGYIKNSNIGFTFGSGRVSIKNYFWFLTPKGEEAAVKSAKYIEDWTREKSELCRKKMEELRKDAETL
jgi:hypothetical protein